MKETYSPLIRGNLSEPLNTTGYVTDVKRKIS